MQLLFTFPELRDFDYIGEFHFASSPVVAVLARFNVPVVADSKQLELFNAK